MAPQVVLQSELPQIQSGQIIVPSLVLGFRKEDFGLFRPPRQILNFGCQLYTNLSLGSFEKWAILRTLSFPFLYGSELVVLDVINGDSCIIVLVSLDAPRRITLWTVVSQETAHDDDPATAIDLNG